MKIGFNKRLQALLAASGMSQEDAARHLGVSSSTVSRWVRGVRVPSAYQLRNLVHFFGLPYTWFLEDVLAVQNMVWEERTSLRNDLEDAAGEGFDDEFDAEADFDTADIAGWLGLRQDTIEALAALAGTSDADVRDAVDEAVYHVVSAANAAYDAMLHTAEQSLRKMAGAEK
ncbi:MAG: helix-turn-helix transcriptional regulator [Oscillospiraceae bacterium]|nr:helix-turn-helix transcriptional regulator [Oscillospiraceae bacterium]